jgi:hypothetical protein
VSFFLNISGVLQQGLKFLFPFAHQSQNGIVRIFLPHELCLFPIEVTRTKSNLAVEMKTSNLTHMAKLLLPRASRQKGVLLAMGILVIFGLITHTWGFYFEPPSLLSYRYVAPVAEMPPSIPAKCR